VIPLLLAVALALDPGALEALEKRAAELDTDALVVLVDGKVVLQKWLIGKPRKLISASVTKSVVALAIGRLVTLGKLRVDQPVADFYPEWRQGRKKLITIRHVLTHTSGLQAKSDEEEIGISPNLLQLALTAELVSDPGSRFEYNDKAMAILAGIVDKVAGKPWHTFVRAEIFAPLGIVDTSFELDPAGNTYAMGGLAIYPIDLIKIGQLMLDRGRWQGREILSPDWVTEATTPSEKNPNYGYLWWLYRDEQGAVVGFGGQGNQGQHLAVFPALRLVAVRMRDIQRVAVTPEGFRRFGFREFPEMVRALLK
jgi:CubicO group peptidase (beta-lactamase class C family)